MGRHRIWHALAMASRCSWWSREKSSMLLLLYLPRAGLRSARWSFRGLMLCQHVEDPVPHQNLQNQTRAGRHSAVFTQVCIALNEWTAPRNAQGTRADLQLDTNSCQLPACCNLLPNSVSNRMRFRTSVLGEFRLQSATMLRRYNATRLAARGAEEAAKIGKMKKSQWVWPCKPM